MPPQNVARWHLPFRQSLQFRRQRVWQQLLFPPHANLVAIPKAWRVDHSLCSMSSFALAVNGSIQIHEVDKNGQSAVDHRPLCCAGRLLQRFDKGRNLIIGFSRLHPPPRHRPKDHYRQDLPRQIEKPKLSAAPHSCWPAEQVVACLDLEMPASNHH